MAEIVALKINGRLPLRSELRIRVEYTESRVKSTNDEITTVVPIKTSFVNPEFIKKALLNAP